MDLVLKILSLVKNILHAITMENISFRAGLAVAIFIMTGNIGLSADLKKMP